MSPPELRGRLDRWSCGRRRDALVGLAQTSSVLPDVSSVVAEELEMELLLEVELCCGDGLRGVEPVGELTSSAALAGGAGTGAPLKRMAGSALRRSARTSRKKSLGLTEATGACAVAPSATMRLSMSAFGLRPSACFFWLLVSANSIMANSAMRASMSLFADLLIFVHVTRPCHGRYTGLRRDQGDTFHRFRGICLQFSVYCLWAFWGCCSCG